MINLINPKANNLFGETGVTLIETCLILVLFSIFMNSIGILFMQNLVIQKQVVWMATGTVLAFNIAERSIFQTEVSVTEWQAQLTKAFPGSTIILNQSEKKGSIVPPPGAVKLKIIEFPL